MNFYSSGKGTRYTNLVLNQHLVKCFFFLGLGGALIQEAMNLLASSEFLMKKDAIHEYL
jgi:hypothetical protein